MLCFTISPTFSETFHCANSHPHQYSTTPHPLTPSQPPHTPSQPPHTPIPCCVLASECVHITPTLRAPGVYMLHSPAGKTPERPQFWNCTIFLKKWGSPFLFSSSPLLCFFHALLLIKWPCLSFALRIFLTLTLHWHNRIIYTIIILLNFQFTNWFILLKRNVQAPDMYEVNSCYLVSTWLCNT